MVKTHITKHTGKLSYLPKLKVYIYIYIYVKYIWCDHPPRAKHHGMWSQVLTMNKASGGDGIPVELYQILKDDAVKVLHSICQPIWKSQQWPQDWKRSVFIPIPKKGNAKGCSNYHTIALISHTSKEMLKLLQARLQQSHWTSRCSSWI